MEILLIGGACAMQESLIGKLHVMGHRIYVMNQKNPRQQKEVFQYFPFCCTSSAVSEVLESVSPDVTIWLGALDPDFTWENSRTSAMEYAAASANLLQCWSALGKGRFLYLSTTQLDDLKQADCTDVRMMSYFQTEHLVEMYRKNQQDTVIIRCEADEMEPVKNQMENQREHIQNLITAIVPYVESIVFFLPFFMLNNRAVGSPFFGKVDVLLWYILLFAMIHGQNVAVFSSVIAAAGYIFRHSYTSSNFTVLTDCNTYVWFVQLLVVGLTVGFLRDHILMLKEEAEEEQRYYQQQIQDIEEINQSNSHMKNLLAEQLVNQNHSIGRLQAIMRKMYRCCSEDFFYTLSNVLSEVTHAKSIAIYQMKGETAVLVNASDERAKQMGSYLVAEDCGEMWDDFKSYQYYINKALKPDLPMMAKAAVLEGEVIFFALLWELELDYMNITTGNLLNVTFDVAKNVWYQKESII